jgi:3-oxoacyl-[acyl-carrier protein] reductase
MHSKEFLKDKWALVTGASRGVGKRIATALATHGAKVIVHSRSLEGTKDLVAQLSQSNPCVYAVAADLGNESELQAMIEKVGQICENQLEILYNNAGMMTPWRDPYKPTVQEYAQSFMTNCIAPVKLADAFIPGMIQRGLGRVIMVTSGIQNQPELMPYSCSKAALDRYVRDMLPTLENTGVLMNLMDPGWLRTDLGGPQAPNDPDSVLPGALVPILLENEQGSGILYQCQELKSTVL